MFLFCSFLAPLLPPFRALRTLARPRTLRHSRKIAALAHRVPIWFNFGERGETRKERRRRWRGRQRREWKEANLRTHLEARPRWIARMKDDRPQQTTRPTDRLTLKEHACEPRGTRASRATNKVKMVPPLNSRTHRYFNSLSCGHRDSRAAARLRANPFAVARMFSSLVRFEASLDLILRLLPFLPQLVT